MAITIDAQERDLTKNPRQLRASGFLPATVYGKGKDSVSIQVNTRNFLNLYKNNKEEVFEIVVGNNKYNAKVQKLQVEAGTLAEKNIEFQLV